MPFLVILVVFWVIVIAVRKSSAARAQLVSSGLPARGLVLSASSTATTSTIGLQRFQVRNVRLDVEVPGRPPYEINISAAFPRMCESFPGTALDLRVDPKNPSNVTIIGPVGASGWIGSTVGILPGAAGMPAAGASGCGLVFAIVVTIFLGMGAVISFLANASSSHESHSTEVEPAEEPEKPAPTLDEPKVTPKHPDCEAAERCCKSLGRAKCSSYEGMSESACIQALKEEKKAAAKAGKTCK